MQGSIKQTERLFWKSKKVLITGHTGFKGSWLSSWLLDLGANVHGFSLPLGNDNLLFEQLRLSESVHSEFANICEPTKIRHKIHDVKPDVIFHMAAQPLVLKSYAEPVNTWKTNVLGTLNLLESTSNLPDQCAIVVITSDKVYENNDQGGAFCEDDRLGGKDPYSASKAAVELLVSSWNNSFLNVSPNIRLITARAGNVIGGGDWAEDRLVPDLIRAWQRGNSFIPRNPTAVRPWQHVLEPLSGYIRLAQKIYEGETLGNSYNFGPETSDIVCTEKVIEIASKYWQGKWHSINAPSHYQEAQTLNLSIHRAKKDLGYKPRWNLSKALEMTMNWYLDVMSGTRCPIDATYQQIKSFGRP